MDDQSQKYGSNADDFCETILVVGVTHVRYAI